MRDVAWNWIDAGQTITCEDGHVIARATVGVLMGTAGDWMSSLLWAIPVPLERCNAECPTCGALWFLTATDGETGRKSSFICVDGEWRGDGVDGLPDGAREYLDGHRSSISVPS